MIQLLPPKFLECKGKKARQQWNEPFEHLKFDVIFSNCLQEQLVTAEQFAKESLKMLLYEPPSTPEGHLAKNAMIKLKSIRENICLFQKL